VFGKSFKLFDLLGFEVKIDPSWFVLAILITWSLAEGLFPAYYQGLATATYWLMGTAAAVGLFFSIVLHELCHSLVARRYDIPMKGITLFIFGGVAEMNQEPKTAKSEMLMAVAGPAASLGIAGIFFGANLAGQDNLWSTPFRGVLQYLALINVILAGFNLIPAFPLDGGRVLRAALWGWKHNLRWATRIASRIGSYFGMLLIVLGVVNFIWGNPLSGVWWFLIGLFLRGVSRNSYRQVLVHLALKGDKVRHFMDRDPVTVPHDITVDQLVDDYVYRYGQRSFPVVEEDSRLVGCVNVSDIKEIPRAEWTRHQVEELSENCTDELLITEDKDATEALTTMQRSGLSRLMVTESGKLVGVISLHDLMRHLSLKMDLEEES